MSRPSRAYDAGAIPQAHQAMLQHGKLIEFVAAVVEKSLHEFRLDGSARLFDRLGDRVLELPTGQIRNEILCSAHRFRQPMEIGAIANEIRAHGGEHTHVLEAPPVGVEENLHKLGRLIARRRPFRCGPA